MTENNSESIDSLCEEYLEISSREVDEDAIQEYKEEMEEWEGRMAELDEGDPLYDTAKEKYEEAKEMYEKEASVEERQRELKEHILDRISSEFSAEKATSRQLKAINRILVAKNREYIAYGSKKVSEDSDVEADKIFDLSMTIRDLANEELGEEQAVYEYSEYLKNEAKSRFEALKAVASHDGTVNTELLANEFDTSKNVAGQRITDENASGDYKPFYANNGEYDLSIVGEYIVQNYLEIDNGETDAEEKNSSVESLNNFSDR